MDVLDFGRSITCHCCLLLVGNVTKDDNREAFESTKPYPWLPPFNTFRSRGPTLRETLMSYASASFQYNHDEAR